MKRQEISYFGNKELLKQHKTGFLCSEKIPAKIVLESYDWAVKMRNDNKCVISGFHSKIEKDVLHFLLKGTQPIIIVLARSMKKTFPPEIKKAIDSNRILIISPFPDSVKRITQETSIERNKYILEISDTIYIPYIHKSGKLDSLLSVNKKYSKKMIQLNQND